MGELCLRKEVNQVKVILQTKDLQIEIDGKEYVISFKGEEIGIYSEDGVEVVEKSELGRWITIK